MMAILKSWRDRHRVKLCAIGLVLLALGAWHGLAGRAEASCNPLCGLNACIAEAGGCVAVGSIWCFGAGSSGHGALYRCKSAIPECPYWENLYSSC